MTVPIMINKISEFLNSASKETLSPLRKNQSIDVIIDGIKITLNPEDVIISIDNSINKHKKQ